MKTKPQTTDDDLSVTARGTRGRLKGARIEKVENKKTAREGEVRLDKSTMTFYGVAGDEVAESQDGKKVRAWVEEQLARTDAFDWKPVLRVRYTAPARSYSGHYEREQRKRAGTADAEPCFDDADKPSVELDVTAERFYIAKGPSGKWRRIGWDHYNSTNPPIDDFAQGQMRDGKEFALPWTDRAHRYGESEDTIVEYSDETWAGLLLLISMLKDNRQKVLDLMRRDTSLGAFAHVGAGQLRKLLGGARAVTSSEE